MQSFVDHVRIHAIAGAGGNGCCAFRREKYVPRGGPSGGDGGHGGDIVLEATQNLTTLLDLSFQPYWKGKSGQHGEGSDCHGKRGAETVLLVPCGTVVRDAESGEVVADLVEPGARFVAAKGGKGGRGNTRFTSSTNRAPHFAERGEPGEDRQYVLELKLIAEAGLVGQPNAGKSTLLARISAARPRVADYPFTTLTPNLGVVQLPGFRSFTAADIPGLIEGAAEGKGLGLEFLRHIERTRVLVFVIDLGDPDPVATWQGLEEELAAYADDLARKPRVFALNKADIPENRERFEHLRAAFPEAYCISAATQEGVSTLLEALWAHIEIERNEAEAALLRAENEPVERVYDFEPAFEIVEADGGYRIEGKRVVRLVRMTNFDNDEAIAYLQRTLGFMGVFRALKRLGAEPGATVFLDDHELEYWPDSN